MHEPNLVLKRIPERPEPYDIVLAVCDTFDAHTAEHAHQITRALLDHTSSSGIPVALIAALDTSTAYELELIGELSDSERFELLPTIAEHAIHRGRYTAAHHTLAGHIIDDTIDQIRSDYLDEFNAIVADVDLHLYRMIRQQAVTVDKQINWHANPSLDLVSRHNQSPVELVRNGAPASILNADGAAELASCLREGARAHGARELADRYEQQLDVADWAALWSHDTELVAGDLHTLLTHPQRAHLIAAFWGTTRSPSSIITRHDRRRATMLRQLGARIDDLTLLRGVHSRWLRSFDDRGAQLLDIDADNIDLWSELVNQIDAPGGDIFDTMTQILSQPARSGHQTPTEASMTVN